MRAKNTGEQSCAVKGIEMFWGSSVQEMVTEVLGLRPTLPVGAPTPWLQQLVLNYEQKNSKDAFTWLRVPGRCRDGLPCS